jgi:hypothetical protein
MKKGTKVLLNLILAGIVSAISYIGFKKGVEAVGKKMKEEEDKIS